MTRFTRWSLGLLAVALLLSPALLMAADEASPPSTPLTVTGETAPPPVVQTPPTPTPQEQAAQLEAQIRLVEQQAAVAATEFKRLQELQAKGEATAEQVAAADANAKSLADWLQTLRADLEQLRKSIAPATPTAPTQTQPTTPPEPDAIAKAQAEVEEAKKAVEAAEVEARRARALQAEGKATQADVDAALAKVKEAVVRLQAAKAHLEELRKAAVTTATPGTPEQLAQARAKFEAAKAAVEATEVEMRRVKALAAEGKASEAEVAAAKAKVQEGVAKLKAARAELEALQKAQAQTKPQTGDADARAKAAANFEAARDAVRKAEAQQRHVKELRAQGKATEKDVAAAHAKVQEAVVKLRAARAEFERLGGVVR